MVGVSAVCQQRTEEGDRQMRISAIGFPNNLTGVSSIQQFDPNKMMDAMVRRFMTKTDANDDGTLTSQELSALSLGTFKTLDTNWDGQLSSDEVKSALHKAKNEMRQARSGGEPQQAISAVKNTPEGQLLQLVQASRESQAQDLSSLASDILRANSGSQQTNALLSALLNISGLQSSDPLLSLLNTSGWLSTALLSSLLNASDSQKTDLLSALLSQNEASVFASGSLLNVLD
ncbi:MAG: hypothetical protein NT154_06310 [Verrucomicrobia bacterium]|nr:hypothetical protein [Verrucomicrobiota bacterium]